MLATRDAILNSPQIAENPKYPYKYEIIKLLIIYLKKSETNLQFYRHFSSGSTEQVNNFKRDVQNRKAKTLKKFSELYLLKGKFIICSMVLQNYLYFSSQKSLSHTMASFYNFLYSFRILFVAHQGSHTRRNTSRGTNFVQHWTSF